MKVLEVIDGIAYGLGTTEAFIGEVRGLVANGTEVVALIKYPNDCELPEARLVKALTELSPDYRPDVVRIHALWSPYLAAAHHWARIRNIPVVVSPHGALSPWARHSKWLKKLPYWYVVERPELKRAAAFHVTAALEETWVRNCGFKQPIEIIPLGVTLPNLEEPRLDVARRTILYVGRLYRVKALDRVAQAIRLLKDRGAWNGWRMVMAGPNWMDYQPELERLIADLELTNDILLPGAVYGDEKERLFRSASFYIAASHTENFCHPVAEALSYGVPVVVSKGCPWSEAESRGCGIRTDNDPESLVEALQRMMLKTDGERQLMGMKGRQWMADSFAWSVLGRQMSEFLARVICAGHGD